jgi:hypothetical protein
VKGWQKIFQANGAQKEAGVPIFTSNKADFKLVRGDKGHFILKRVTIQQKDIILVYICAKHQ